MNKKLYTHQDYKMSKWSGGNTRELAIYPEDSKYLDRDFIWRLSSADSDLEESSFTKLPDFDRILMVLEGDVILAHGDVRTAKLGKMDQDTFDGSYKTKCFGKLIRDYNLIMKKGAKGRMEAVNLEESGREISLKPRQPEDRDGIGGECGSYGVFCVEGYALVSIDGVAEMVKADEQLVINCQPSEMPHISLMGEGSCIFTEVIFQKEAMGFEEIPKEEVEGSDYIHALKLFVGNNKWNKAMQKAGRKGIWMSPALEKQLRFIDKFFITGIVWVLGLTGCLGTMTLGLSTGTVFCLAAGFSLLHVFLIAPVIYMILLPKPIGAHIKKYDDLNSYEKTLYEEQVRKDIHHEKLMHKYRDRAGEEYDGMKDFIRKLNK